MVRRFVLGFIFGFVAFAAQAETQWNIYASAGLDAAAFIGPLSGEPLATRHKTYDADVSQFRDRMSKDAIAALERIDSVIRGDQKSIVTASLTLYFSAGDTHTLDDIIKNAEDPMRLRNALKASPYWDEEGWDAFISIAPDIATVLNELKQLGFEKHWHETIYPTLEKKAAELNDYLAPFDIAAEASRLLGRTLDDEVDVVVAHYIAPFGIRIIGQRYLTHPSYSNKITLRTAAHEMFHPPFDMKNHTLRAKLGDLKNDPWMKNIVEGHNPAFGYNSFGGVVNEDSTKALDQLIGERLGFSEDMGERLRKSDDGMHMLAAALYHAMKEDRFDMRGGKYETWLSGAIDRGLLTPEEVRRRAGEIVGEDAVAKWNPEK